MRRINLLGGCVAAVLLFAAHSASALTLGPGLPGGVLDPSRTDAELQILDAGPPQVLGFSITETVVRDSSANGWPKFLNYSFTAPIGQEFTLRETLTVGAGSEAIGQWRQDIISAGWQWVIGGVSVTGASATATVDNAFMGPYINPLSSVLIAFATPLQAGDEITIESTLKFIGGPDPQNPGPLFVAQYPLPVPGAALLFGSAIGALGWIGRKRRQA